MMKSLRKRANVTDGGSLANTLRKKRFARFLDIYRQFNGKTVSILDIGGTVNFWEQMHFTEEHCVITLVNPEVESSPYHNIISKKGLAENLSQFGDNQFDIVFSNSVIEHLFIFENQQLMASEVRRLAPVYFVQTPAYEFPMEPHFLFPGFHYLPRKVKVWLTQNFNLGWYKKAESRKEAEIRVDEIRLLKKREVKEIFPDAEIVEEKFYGLTKSYIAIKNTNTNG